MARISLLELPYDSGYFNARMGRGPRALLENALAEHLHERGFDVDVAAIALSSDFRTEASALVELQRAATPILRRAIERGTRPILLSGNCGPAALSAMAALPQPAGVIWFDAHADFNTPETSASGFLDGMGLSILTGGCWRKLAERFDGFTPVATEHVVQIGMRDVDAGEQSRLDQSGITQIAPNELNQLPDALRALAGRVAQIYVHVDVDVLDISEGRANTYACGGGLSVPALESALELIAQTIRISAASITSYDPEADHDGRIGRAIPRIAELLAQ